MAALCALVFGANACGAELKAPAWSEAVDLHFTGIGQVLANVSGGIRRGAVYEGLLETRLALDLEKLAGFQGTAFFANVLYPHGSSLTERYVGDFNVVSNIDAFDTVRLHEIWLEKAWGDDAKGVSVRAGKLSIDTEFILSEHGAVLINSSFGAWPLLSQMDGVAIWPLSLPGVRLEAHRDQWIARTGVFAGSTRGEVVNANGTRFEAGTDDGVLWIGELGWRAAGETDESLPRVSLKAGVFFTTADTANLRTGRDHDGNGGIYAAGEGELFRTGSCAVGGFARAGAVPEDRNVAAWYLEGGATCCGLFCAGDSLVAGVSYTRFSSRLPAAGSEPTHHETVIELTYQTALLFQCLRVQPDVQYICNPGGVIAAPDAVVLGLRCLVLY